MTLLNPSRRRWLTIFAAALTTGFAAVAATLPFDFIHFGNFTRMVEAGAKK